MNCKLQRAEAGPSSRRPENEQPSGRIGIAAAGGFAEAASGSKGAIYMMYGMSKTSVSNLEVCSRSVLESVLWTCVVESSGMLYWSGISDVS